MVRQCRSWASRIGASVCMGLALFLALPVERASAQRPRVSENNPPQPRDRAFFFYDHFANVAIEGGGSFGSVDGSLSGNFGPTPPTGHANINSAFLGGDASIRLPLFSALRPAVTSGPVFLGPTLGVRGRAYFDAEGRFPFDIHPTPVPTTLTYERNYAIMPYVGIPIGVGDPFGTGVPVVITPKLGANIENGKVTLVTNEAGPVSTFSRTQTGVGFHGGLDIDMFFAPTGNLRPFIGVGAFVNTSPDLSLQGRSQFPFDYRAKVEQDVQGGFVVRLGAAFGGQ